MASTFPPGQISQLGKQLLKENRAPHITYVSPNGTKFYLSGPLAPTLGAQNGVALMTISGLTPPFRHLDNQGAHQDGTTWVDSVYEPGEIDMVCEASGLTPSDMRRVMRSWLGAWNPKEQGRLHVFTPEGGEWWARVRPLKSFNDQITYSHTNYGTQKFTWAARNDDAFWESFDSVDTFRMTLMSGKASDSFDGAASSTLGSNWVQTYKSGSNYNGYCGLSGDGSARWYPNVGDREVINRRIGANSTTTTDYQVVSIQLKSPVGFDFLGGVYVDIWGRMDANGNGIRARIGGIGGSFSNVILSSFTNNGNTETVLWRQPLKLRPLWNETWTLVCGTENGVRNFKIQRGKGHTVVSYKETGTNSRLGSAYRGFGFGMAAGNSLLQYQVAPPDIKYWEAGDNTPITQSGKLDLVNRGELEAWPRYLVYGPGTFTFSDADNTANKITFGPLLEDQIALVTTLPRLRGVVDLSPALPEQELTNKQKLITKLVDLATNNNTPPLLEQFESKFGILPPQGPLYGLLNGRFTTPIRGRDNDGPPVVTSIEVSITDGNAESKVIGAVTPRRRWPM